MAPNPVAFARSLARQWLRPGVVDAAPDDKQTSGPLEALRRDFPAIADRGAALDFNLGPAGFSRDAARVNDGVHWLNDVALAPGVKPIFDYDNLDSGTPLKYKPFPLCVSYIRRHFLEGTLHWYPASSGPADKKATVRDFFNADGFDITTANVCFTASCTMAWHFLLDLLLKPGDAVVTTAPGYGLFTIMPETHRGAVWTVALSAEDDWRLDPAKLAAAIDAANAELAECHAGADYIPRVKIFLNMNPHNPTGRVMWEEAELAAVGRVCLDRDVWIVDDLVYRDLTFDRAHLARPIATLPEYFANTVSLFGLSKSFGLASLRAAVVIAPDAIVKGLTKLIWQQIDSVPTLQCAAVAGAFNLTRRRDRAYRRYMGAVIPEYQYRFHLFRAMVHGLDAIAGANLKAQVKADIDRYSANPRRFDGIPGVSLYEQKMPESGFFTVLDLTGLRGKSHGGKTIDSELDVIEYLYAGAGLKYISGSGMTWPEPDRITARVAFSVSREAIVQNLVKLGDLVRALG
jgi:aspartate/methionine/tyrosine aminotransferase